MRNGMAWVASLALGGLALAACVGETGPTGEPGADGADGVDGQRGADCWDINGNGEPDVNTEDINGDGSVDILDCSGLGESGEDGEDGEDWSAPYHVGTAECADCHEEQYQKHARSGHPYELVEIGGVDPVDEPWHALGSFGHYAPEPPDGWDWADISYVVGGWGWKQHFLDLDGYLVTGNEVQYDLATGDWTALYEDEAPGTRAYDCASCHTTGYRPDDHQGGLPGITGTWDAPGVQCEECHGNGSQHIADPYLVPMAVDRSAELCGSCHYRTDPSFIPASDGFILDRGQWNELSHSKKRSMDCIDCHDPHASAHHEEPTWNPGKGIHNSCAECHFDEAANQDSFIMAVSVACIDCHMPYATLSAVGDTETWTGDVRTHLFAINTDIDAGQFSEDGSESNPYLSLDFACRSCHSDGGGALHHTDEELQAKADGYHGD